MKLACNPLPLILLCLSDLPGIESHVLVQVRVLNGDAGLAADGGENGHVAF